MILVITCKEDFHADEVIRSLASRDVSPFRLNTEALLTDYRVALHIDAHGAWTGTIEDCTGRRLDFRNVRTIWLRKPSHDFELPRPVRPEVYDFIALHQNL